MRRNPLVILFWRVHKWLYQRSGGRLGAKLAGLPILLLYTTGRKTGLRRSNALTYLPYDDRYVVVASNAGADFHPAWWLNLQANPRAQVQVGTEMVAVMAREANDAEREQLWPQFVRLYRRYAVYKQRTDRRIPIVVLEPM